MSIKISPVVLGQNKSRYSQVEIALGKKGLSAEEIKNRITERMSEDALALGLALDEYQSQLAAIKSKSGEKVTEHKEQFRTEFDKLTNNLLFTVNNTSDERVKVALSELLIFDKTFQVETGIKQTDRNDFRGLIILSSHPTNPDKFSIYRGGWGDGSKKDRNQYSNGRRVPVAKTTGYALKQTLPEMMVNATPEAVAEVKPEVKSKRQQKKERQAKGRKK